MATSTGFSWGTLATDIEAGIALAESIAGIVVPIAAPEAVPILQAVETGVNAIVSDFASIFGSLSLAKADAAGAVTAKSTASPSYPSALISKSVQLQVAIAHYKTLSASKPA